MPSAKVALTTQDGVHVSVEVVGRENEYAESVAKSAAEHAVKLLSSARIAQPKPETSSR